VITVNRRDRVQWRAGMTVEDLLEAMRYTHPQVVVTINGDLVAHDAYGEVEVPDGADVRVVHLMAGG
jgi:sulfur carrier protein